MNIEGAGKQVTTRQLADRFLLLERAGCHNIHWISPTHQLPFLVDALDIARSCGLELPVVYNTGGYESKDVLRLIEGVVDIYLPDFKFWSEDVSYKYMRVRGYPEAVRESILEMHRQVGRLHVDGRGVAVRGLIVRHLVMPGYLEETRCILQWVASELGRDTAVSLMGQYRPEYRASRYPKIAQPSPRGEWLEAVSIAAEVGLINLLPQYETTHHPPPPLLIRKLETTQGDFSSGYHA